MRLSFNEYTAELIVWDELKYFVNYFVLCINTAIVFWFNTQAGSPEQTHPARFCLPTHANSLSTFSLKSSDLIRERRYSYRISFVSKTNKLKQTYKYLNIDSKKLIDKGQICQIWEFKNLSPSEPKKWSKSINISDNEHVDEMSYWRQGLIQPASCDPVTLGTRIIKVNKLKYCLLLLQVHCELFNLYPMLIIHWLLCFGCH